VYDPLILAAFDRKILRMTPSEVVEKAETLRAQGCVVLPGLFPLSQVEWARALVLGNLGFLKQTRPHPSARHLAGFHRYPDLEPLHTWISGNAQILEVLGAASGAGRPRSIGLSDITVNRSQAWHVDLLRGKYQHHLTTDLCWGVDGGGVYKALVYLQAGKSLKVVPGAHVVPRSLDKDSASEPADSALIQSLFVEAGDVILMDIRLPHCGSSEEELARTVYLGGAQKILLSTVLGAHHRSLTRAMEIGNFARLQDWDAAHP